jgi:hypothetical protein
LLAGAAAATADPSVTPVRTASPPTAALTGPRARKAIEWLLLPNITMKDADFDGALEFLRRKGEEASGGALKLKVVRNLPADVRPRHEITLDLKNVPFVIGLKYLGELAGVEFAIEGTTVIANTPGTTNRGEDLRRYLPWQSRWEPFQMKGLTGELAKPSESTYSGRSTYRNTRGVLMTEKSGHVPHRSMAGLPITKYPENSRPVDCPHVPPCELVCVGATKGGTAKPTPPNEAPPR